MRLRNETGTALADAMVGSLIAAVTIVGLASVTMATQKSLTATITTAETGMALHSLLATSAADVTSVPETPVVSDGVALWRDGDTLYAGSPTIPAPDADCTALGSSDCVYAQLNVPAAATAYTITTDPVPVVWPGDDASTDAGVLFTDVDVATFTPDPLAVETRYILHLTADQDGTLTVADTDTDEVLASIPFTAGDNAFRYGSLMHDAGTTLTLVSDTEVTLSHVYLYGAP